LVVFPPTGDDHNMSTDVTLLSEAEILSQVINPQEPGLTPELARLILDWRFGPDALRRMNELAEKNRLGTSTAGERRLLENYQRVGNFLNLLQAKARLSLVDRTSSPS
jgi:hypothetical protein